MPQPVNVTNFFNYDTIANYYLYRVDATPTLTAPAAADATTLTVDSITGVSAGDAITMYEDSHIFQSLVLSAVSSTITIASPIDIAFTTSAIVEVGPWSMNVDGSVTPQVFKIMAPPDKDFHVHSLNGTMLDQSAMDDALFGGLPALTNGIVYQYSNSFNKAFALIVNNTGFYEYGFNIEYASKAPSGYYGFRFRVDINEKTGSNVKLEKNGAAELQLIVRDNLTGLDKLTSVVNGFLR